MNAMDALPDLNSLLTAIQLCSSVQPACTVHGKPSPAGSHLLIRKDATLHSPARATLP